MRTILIAGLGSLVLGACHGANCAPSGPNGLIAGESNVTPERAEEVALDAVYDAYPSRALVEKADTRQVSLNPPVYSVRFEMSGGAAYKVQVMEQADGQLVVSRLDKLQ